MLVVGLTGGIASGKSTVSCYLQDLGAVIIDTDQLAREMVQPNSPVLQEITAYFGKEILVSTGELDRKKLADRIFTSNADREKLNNIFHPVIIGKVQDLITKYKEEGKVPLIVVDAPLLLETGMQRLVDEVWVIAIPNEVQLARLMKRDGINQVEAQTRLNSQMPLKEKIRQAHRVIDNSQTIADTLVILDSIWAEVVNIH